MDATPPSTATPEHSSDAPAPSPRPSAIRAKRHYRTKKRDDESEDENEEEHAPNSTSKITVSSTATEVAIQSNLPFVQSQNAQNIAEVYPGLSRLSFLDQEQATIESEHGMDSGLSLLGSKKPRRPLQQRPQEVPSQENTEPLNVEEGSTMDVHATDRSSAQVPPATSPSALSSGAGSGASLVQIKDTGSDLKGRGVFSAATEVLKPGALVFRELGYCQVVKDASLSQVCSACFKDTREEQGEDEGSASSAGVLTSGHKKLVRCAGCKVLWYCNKACQIKDWKLHHQMECKGIQKSMTDPVMKDVWTKRTLDTTTVRALCRLIRRRERVKKSAEYKAEHEKIDMAQKQVNEVYFSGLDQKEEEWLDENGAAWIERYLSTDTQRTSRTSAASSKAELQESSQLAKILAVVMSCVVTPREDRLTFLKGASDSEPEVSEAGGFSLLRTLMSYGFNITNLETTTAIGMALFVQCMPFMNHSCVPNCVYTFKGPRVECRVIRDIQPGEELMISYIDQIGTTQERQKQLQEQYHFSCDCPLCKYFPANPLAQPDEVSLMAIAPELHFGPVLDPKQGFVCRNVACSSSLRSVLASDAQLAIYNKVELKCPKCGHIAELTQELVQENQEDSERLIAGFVREMNSGSKTSKTGARNFELAKAELTQSTEETLDSAAPKPALVGGLKTVQEPSAPAVQYFDDAYKTLTGGLPPHPRSRKTPSTTTVTGESDLIPRSDLHRLTRQLVQKGFDEAVSHKNWVFALNRSIQLERIFKETYIGHHPLKAIQGYYTCKIANLLANLLLEESTVEIEESDHGDEDEDEELGGKSDDERDLKALRDAMGEGSRVRAAAASGSGSIQEQLLKKKRKENEDEKPTEGKVENQGKKPAQDTSQYKRPQMEASRELMEYLKSLIPKIEDPLILQQFKVCWGKDGKLASRYRYQVDSLKQALHYAELPFARPTQYK
ncbi:SET and MYND domain-containing protein 3 [Mortierella sp. GBA30]|nr:SET and MYND domain-containing protein 3 [Mortierella sp. GBA30]